MRTIHMVGNAHIDPVWLWQKQEGKQVALATFRSALERMNEYPEFIFTQSQAVLYKWVEEIAPDVFRQIKKRVKEGRWRLAGGWWVEPDCNILSGESFIRQGLYGQGYFKEKFGVRAKAGYNVDSFGHNAMLPQILKKMGIDHYVFMRPNRHENKDIPGSLFLWRSPDGSEVVTFRIIDAYCNGLSDDLAGRLSRFNEGLLKSPDSVMLFYGVGDHGGGPTKANIEAVKALQENDDGTKTVFSSPDDFFAGVKKSRLPVWRRELQHHARGCYSAHSGIKRLNRLAENTLLAAEAWQAVKAVLAPRAQCTCLEAAWEKLLFNQFHDILAGSSTQKACRDAEADFGYVISTARDALHDGLLAIEDMIDMRKADYSIVVFNPSMRVRKEPAEVEFTFWEKETLPRLVDSRGNEVMYQKSGASSLMALFSKYVFPVNLGALGYEVFYLKEGRSTGGTSPDFDNAPVLENEWMKITFSGRTAEGSACSIYDKKGKRELLKDPVRAAVLNDESDTWSHGVDSYEDCRGSFRLRGAAKVESGAVYETVRAVSRYGKSELTEEFTLYRQYPYIEMRVRLDWRERHKLLRYCFPLA